MAQKPAAVNPSSRNIVLITQVRPDIPSNLDSILNEIGPYVRRCGIDGIDHEGLKEYKRNYPDIAWDRVENIFDEHDLTAITNGTDCDWCIYIPVGTDVRITPSFNVDELDRSSAGYRVRVKDTLGLSRWRCMLVPVNSATNLSDYEGAFELNGESIRNCYDICLDFSKNPGYERSISIDILLSPWKRTPFQYARALEILGDINNAVEAYRALAEETDSQEVRWFCLYRLAELRLSGKTGLGNSIELFLAAFECWPKRAEPLIRLIEFFYSREENEKAMKLLDIAVAIAEPTDAGYFNQELYRHDLVAHRAKRELIEENDKRVLQLCNEYLQEYQTGRVAEDINHFRNHAYAQLYPIANLNIDTENAFLIIVTFRNASKFLRDCIDSISQQSYRNYHVVFVDDASDYHTIDDIDMGKIASYEVIKNPRQRGVMANQFDALQNHKNEDDIAVFLDGDDKFANADVLTTLNTLYNRSACWLTYGQYRRSNDGGIGFARPIVPGESLIELFKNDNFLFPVSPRTHRVGLFHRIAEQDPKHQCFRDKHGKFFSTSADVAQMRALFHLAGVRRIRYVPEILYIYNTENPESEFRIHARLRKEEFECMRELPVLSQTLDYRPASAHGARSEA